MAKRITLILVAVALIVVGGCYQPPRSSRSMNLDGQPLDLVAEPKPLIADLPVPDGFTIDEDRSRSFASAGTRWVDYVYAGGADKHSVGRFYKRQMPICRWALVTDMFTQGEIQLIFEKEGESCCIKINGSGTVRIAVTIWPKGRGTLKIGTKKRR